MELRWHDWPYEGPTLTTGLAPVLRDDPDIVAGFARDQTDILCPGTPRGVFTARTADDVVDLLRWASTERVPVIPRGGGTGISGAACAFDGCVILDLASMNAIKEIHPGDRVAVVEPGVINAELSVATKPYGLMYAPDPSSWESSTIGGNIATNAGGLRCVRYGVTRTSVLGLQVVLADGRVLRTGGRTLKRSAGYDLTQLMIGSEGTLGVVVEATVRLHPLPPPEITALLTFDDAAQAAACASAIVANGPLPTMLELMDAASVRAIDAYRGTGFGDTVAAVLLAKCDDSPDARHALESVARAHGAQDVLLADSDAEANELLDIRRAAYPALQQLGQVLVEDVAVPVSRLAEAIAAVEAVGASTGVEIATVAHAGDGNLHPLLVLPPAGEEALWDAADQVFRAAMALGGTVSGEHGIGRLKKRWLAQEVGETSIDVQRGIKDLFDPLHILNPGAILD